MIATTIISSISVKPFWAARFMLCSCFIQSLQRGGGLCAYLYAGPVPAGPASVGVK
jgi:hypothetical protein